MNTILSGGCPFSILELKHSTSPAEIDRKWKRMMLKVHTDKLKIGSSDEPAKRLNDARERAQKLKQLTPKIIAEENERIEKEEKERTYKQNVFMHVMEMYKEEIFHMLPSNTQDRTRFDEQKQNWPPEERRGAEILFHTGMSGQTTISDLQRALDATKQREATLTEQVHALQQRLDDERPSEKEQAAALKQKDHAIAAERTLIEDALDEERRREDDVLAAIERRQKDDAIAALERRQKDDALAALDGERRRAEDAMAALDAERRRADDAMAALDIERTRAEDVLTALNIERSRAEDALNQKAELEKELAIMSMFQRVEEADSDQEFRDAEPIAKKRKYRSVFSFADNKVIDTMFHAGGRRRMHHPPRLPATTKRRRKTMHAK
jgi:hypothetical protein